jgi:hypothetical protein
MGWFICGATTPMDSVVKGEKMHWNNWKNWGSQVEKWASGDENWAFYAKYSGRKKKKGQKRSNAFISPTFFTHFSLTFRWFFADFSLFFLDFSLFFRCFSLNFGVFP